MSENTPLVSVCTLAYNHEPYIRECLDGILMQKTNFAFELLIHDDASTDGTADIIREYEAKYPDIIKPIYQTENQYSKGVKINATIQFPRAKGKYIALCEGDDYWTDPLKLQKQVDFMEAKEEYSLCFHNAKVIYEHKNKEPHLFANIENREYSAPEIYETWYIQTATVLFKAQSLFKNIDILQTNKFYYGDNPLFCTLSLDGKLYGMKDVMSAYRVNNGGVTNLFSKDTDKLLNHQIVVLEIFNEKYGIQLTNRIIKSIIFRYICENVSSNKYKTAIDTIRNCKKYLLLKDYLYIIRISISSIIRKYT